MEQGADVGGMGIEVTQGAQEEIEELRDRVLGLGHQFDELDKVCRKLGPEEIGAKPLEGLDQDGLAERVKIAPVAGSVADVVEEEEIELAREGAPGPARAFCGGLEAAMGLRKPGDDPTGLAQAGAAQKDRGSALQGNESFDAGVRIGKKSFMAEDTTQTGVGENTPTIDTENLRTTYANVCRIAQTPNEMIVDFGLNPNFFGAILPEPLKLENRIILSHDGAKRLMLHLANAIQSYEAKYGVIELDVAKRLKQK